MKVEDSREKRWFLTYAPLFPVLLNQTLFTLSYQQINVEVFENCIDVQLSMNLAIEPRNRLIAWLIKTFIFIAQCSKWLISIWTELYYQDSWLQTTKTDSG